MLQTDDNFPVAVETLRPTITAIKKVRAGEKSSPIARSDIDRVLLLLNSDPAKAVRLADELLRAKPADVSLQYLKALAMHRGDKPEEAIKLLTELGDKGFAPALWFVATEFVDSDDDTEAKKAPGLFERYIALEPYDPRGFSQLGSVYEDAEEFDKAAAAYRKAIEIDPGDTNNYLHLIELVLRHNVPGDVKALLAAGEKVQQADDDLFGWVMRDLTLFDAEAAKKFAAAEPLRLKTNPLANRSLGELATKEGRFLQAERLLNTAVQLDKRSPETEKDSVAAYLSLAKLYRKQSRWLTALKAADQAIAVDASRSEGHYQRACALARLRRFDEAIAALSKAVELSRFESRNFAEEPDLKPLSNLPAFKKLLPPPKEQP
jgi:tetratricopeptide (TPR) repeat protein